MPAPSSRLAKPLLGVAVALLAGGAVLAVTQPGDLGDDTDTAAPAVTTTTTSTTQASASTASTATPTTATGPTTTAAPAVTTATTGGSQVGGQVTTSPTTAGSGLGTPGASRADDATATTGIESMLLPGVALAAAAVAVRGAARRTAS